MPKESFPRQGVVLPEKYVGSSVEKVVNRNEGEEKEVESLTSNDIKEEYRSTTVHPKPFSEQTKADLVQTAQDRGRIRALKNISRWEQEERADTQKLENARRIKEKSLLNRIKGWFTKKPPEDNRTLRERIFLETGEVLPGKYPATEEIELKPKPDLVTSSTDQARIRALKNVSAWEQEEKTKAQSKNGFLSKIKGWFAKEPPEDDRTLKERMEEIEAAELLEEVRHKLAFNPSALTRQDLVLLSEEEMLRYRRWQQKL